MCGWVPVGTSSTTSYATNSCSTSLRSWSRTAGRASHGRIRATSRPPLASTKAGIHRYAPSSLRSTRLSSGRCSTGVPSNAGQSGARRSLAMPAIPCCRSWPKALLKRSRTAQCLRPVSRALAAQTSRRHCVATSSFGYPVPPAFKRCRLQTRRASTSPTVPTKRNATQKWRLDQPTGRRRRSPGSTNTTPPSSNRRTGKSPPCVLPSTSDLVVM
jgi:hypothetical protein